MLLALVALSFFCLSYASQTHIHGQPAAGPNSAVSKLLHLDRATITSQKPGNDDSSDATCPLCQAVAVGSAILIPLVLALLVLVRSAEDGRPLPCSGLCLRFSGKAINRAALLPFK